MNTDSFLYFALLMLFSGFLSYAKVPLTAFRKQQKYNGNDTRQQVVRGNSAITQCNLLRERADDYLLTIFTVQTLAKTAAAIFLYIGFTSISVGNEPLFSVVLAMILTLVVAFVFLLGVAEIFARALAKASMERAAKIIFGPVVALHFITRPLTLPCESLIKWLKSSLKIPFAGMDIPAMAEDLIDSNSGNAVLEQSEMEMISSIVEFRDTIVREVMVPRVDMKCIPAEATLEEGILVLRVDLRPSSDR